MQIRVVLAASIANGQLSACSTAEALVQSIIQPSTEQERVRLLPSEVQHYLFQVSPRTGAGEERESGDENQKQQDVSMTKVGRISMVWKTCMVKRQSYRQRPLSAKYLRELALT